MSWPDGSRTRSTSVRNPCQFSKCSITSNATTTSNEPDRKGTNVSLRKADTLGLILAADLAQGIKCVVERENVLSAAGQAGRPIGEAATGVQYALLTDEGFGETVPRQMLVHEIRIGLTGDNALTGELDHELIFRPMIA